MKRLLTFLGVCALICFSLQLSSAVKNECCPTHFQILKAYQESAEALVEKVKAESLEDFEKRYHDKEALTYLNLAVESMGEIADHYKQMGASEDEAAVRGALSRVDKYIKQLKDLKGAQAKRLVESISLAI
jgi:glycine cleavage system pyridoxal-binding protein P